MNEFINVKFTEHNIKLHLQYNEFCRKIYLKYLKIFFKKMLHYGPLHILQYFFLLLLVKEYSLIDGLASSPPISGGRNVSA